MREELVDKYFPIKDRNGNPSYRIHQKEAILSILKQFETKKFVCLDGPVGCGKSVILYTVGMVMGNTTYLTPQKQLQDQITKENWPGVKMVKGRGAYACNAVNDNNIRCNYSGSRYVTCNNSEKKNGSLGKDGGVIGAIKNVISKFGSNEMVLRMRTGFETTDDIESEFLRIKTYISSKLPADGRISTSSFIGCPVDVAECPVKSARILAQMAKVRVLNPDVFYTLNKGQNQYFPSSSLMVIDECHKLENVVGRIFGGYIHIDFLKKYFGIDLSALYKEVNSEGFIKKYKQLMNDVVLPAKCAAITVGQLSVIMKMKHLGGNQKFSILMNSDLASGIASVSKSLGDRRIDFNPIDFLSSVFSGIQFEEYAGLLNGAWNACRKYYTDICGDNKCNTRFYSFGDMPIKRIAWFSEAIDHLESVMDVPDVFMFSKESIDIKEKVVGSDLYRFVKDNVKDTNTVSLKLTPVNVASIMNMFFYSKAEKVILSTGTWVDDKNMMKTFGVNLNSYGVVTIPTTFSAKRRPVYLVNGDMDFARKIESAPYYYYKTPKGEHHFTKQVGDIVSSVRSYLNEQNGSNVNFIIHSFSFDITKRIAESCPYVDDSWLIQIGQKHQPIRNKHTGHVTSFIHKDEILQYMYNHPNSGTTLVSPSVAEGVDFKHDIARAQIILKRPTPNIGDPYVNSQYKGNPTFNIPRDPGYIDRATYTEMMQMYGRIMRAQDDWGITIIYDQAIIKPFSKLLMPRSSMLVKKLGLDYLVSAIKGGIGDGGKPYYDWLF